jgi:hypothetical protein
VSNAARYRLPEQLGGSVEAELARVGSPGSSEALSRMLRVWPTAVGEAIARNAWPARSARDGTVVVHVSSSAWAHELTQLEETVRAQLGDAAPERLRFVVGPLPEPGGGSREGNERPELRPSPADAARAEALAGGIEAKELRESVKRAAALSLAASRTARPDRPF